MSLSENTPPIPLISFDKTENESGESVVLNLSVSCLFLLV